VLVPRAPDRRPCGERENPVCESRNIAFLSHDRCGFSLPLPTICIHDPQTMVFVYIDRSVPVPFSLGYTSPPLSLLRSICHLPIYLLSRELSRLVQRPPEHPSAPLARLHPCSFYEPRLLPRQSPPLLSSACTSHSFTLLRSDANGIPVASYHRRLSPIVNHVQRRSRQDTSDSIDRDSKSPRSAHRRRGIGLHWNFNVSRMLRFEPSSNVSTRRWSPLDDPFLVT